MFRRMTLAALPAVLTMAVAAGGADAATLRITVTNNQGPGGLYLTPLFTALHGGGFDPFDEGETASVSVRDLAEEGIPGGLIADAMANPTAVITSPRGFPGAPVIDPGETARTSVDVDPMSHRFLTFLSMVIPSNDSFIGNDNPMAYEVFDALGRFTGLASIQVFGGDVWDAGTEVNSSSGVGAAFSTAGGVGPDENGVVRRAGDLGFLLGTPIPTGGTIGSVPGRGDLLATISVEVVPVPAALPLLLGGLGLLGAVGRRRKRMA